MRRSLLNKLILGSCAGPFMFGILIFVLIFVAGDLLFQAAKLIIEQGVAFNVVARLFFYRLPEVVILTGGRVGGGGGKTLREGKNVLPPLSSGV